MISTKWHHGNTRLEIHGDELWGYLHQAAAAALKQSGPVSGQPSGALAESIASAVLFLALSEAGESVRWTEKQFAEVRRLLGPIIVGGSAP